MSGLRWENWKQAKNIERSRSNITDQGPLGLIDWMTLRMKWWLVLFGLKQADGHARWFDPPFKQCQLPSHVLQPQIIRDKFKYYSNIPTDETDCPIPQWTYHHAINSRPMVIPEPDKQRPCPNVYNMPRDIRGNYPTIESMTIFSIL